MDRQRKLLVEVGDVIAGRYRVDRVLGRGAMGIVVAATHIELHQTRAIKFMLPDVMHDRDNVERFLREARAAARLQSQHAVKVQDVARLPTGEPYIVMEYLRGIDLKTYLENQGVLRVPEAALYMTQACEAIAEAHAMGIVHRDLKPANMFLAERAGGVPVLKVLDFGIAKLNDAHASDSDGQLTSTHMVIGSPLFMSPEQIISTRSVDARSDIWSMGVILYTLVTGTMPFLGESAHAVFAAVQRDAPVPPSSWNPALPPEIEHIILRCLEKDPARRYANAAELGAALAPFTGQARLPVPSTPFAQAGSDTNVATQVWHRSSSQHPAEARSPSAPQSGAQGRWPSTSQPGAQAASPGAPPSGAQASLPGGPQPGAQGPWPGGTQPAWPGGPQPGAQAAWPGAVQLGAQAAWQGASQPGAQTSLPVTKLLTSAKRPQRREVLLAAAGFSAALLVIALMMVFSRCGESPPASQIAAQAFGEDAAPVDAAPTSIYAATVPTASASASPSAVPSTPLPSSTPAAEAPHASEVIDAQAQAAPVGPAATPRPASVPASPRANDSTTARAPAAPREPAARPRPASSPTLSRSAAAPPASAPTASSPPVTGAPLKHRH